MPLIIRTTMPEDAFLNQYWGQGFYTDCYAIDFPICISLEQYVESFYKSPLFKLEREILNYLLKSTTDDRQAKCLARGDIAHFSAWTVEARSRDQLLLCDVLKRTRSWLMCRKLAEAAKTVPGYLGEEAWENPKIGLISNVYYWESPDALCALMHHSKHLEAKAKQSQWLDGYQVVISQVIKIYGDERLGKFLRGRNPDPTTALNAHKRTYETPKVAVPK